MPQTYSSGVPARGCEVLLISLERCSRLATVASEENEGSSMIGRFRRPHKRTTGRELQKNYLWSRGGSLFGTETSRSALSQKSVLRTRVPLWLSPESFHLKHATDFPLFTPPAFIVGDCQRGVRPHHLPLLFSRFRLFVQSRASHLTPQHWLLCHLG